MMYDFMPVMQINDGILGRCNKSTPQKLVNDLLSAMYNDIYLATHSLGGKSSKESCKEGLPAEGVEKVIGKVQLGNSHFTVFYS